MKHIKIRLLSLDNVIVDSSKIFASRIFGLTISFICTVIIARTFATEELANYLLLANLGAFLTVIFCFGYQSHILRTTSSPEIHTLIHNNHKKILLLTTISCVALIILINFTGILNLPWTIALSIIILASSVNAASQIVIASIRTIQCNSDYLSAFGVSQNILNLIAVAILHITNSLNLYSFLLSTLLISTLGLAVTKYYFFSTPKIIITSDPTSHQPWNIMSPFFWISILIILPGKVDLFLLNQLATKDEVNEFGIALKLYETSLIPTLAFGIAMSHSIKNHIQLKTLDRFVKLNMMRIFAISLILGTCMLAFAEFIIVLLFGDVYAGARTCLQILSIGLIINSPFFLLIYVLNYNNHEDLVLKSLAVILVIELLLGLFLIPKLGAVGAALSMTVSVFIWRLYLAYAIYKKMQINLLKMN